VLVGAGNLGRALMAYNGFDAKGFRLVAVFDADPAKIGKRQGPFAAQPGAGPAGDKRFFVVQPLSELKSVIEKQGIRLAILAVPGDSAQEVAEQCVDAGIRGLLNFAPVSLSLPSHIAINAVDLAVQLEQLSFQVNFSPLGQTG
jgi:redox-sensing transcriptional repressor